MMPLLLFQPETGLDWSQFGMSAGLIFVIFLFLYFLLKALPTWERIETKRIGIRDKEAEMNGQLANALNILGNTMQNIAVEQRRTTDNILRLQRANASETNSITDTVDGLANRIDSLEDSMRNEGYATHNRPKAVATK